MTSGEKAAKTRQANALKLCRQWNTLYPIGTPVTVELDSGEIVSTSTRSDAQMLGAEPSRNDSGHTAVIWLKEFPACYALSRVRPKGGTPHA